MRKLLALVAITLILVVGLTSCEFLMDMLGFTSQEGVTAEERINLFESALNSADRSNLRNHFHPDMLNYDQVADDVVIATGPLSYANAPFIIGAPSIVGDVATSSFENFWGATGTVVFTLLLDGLDYKIRRLVLTLDVDPTTNYTIELNR